MKSDKAKTVNKNDLFIGNDYVPENDNKEMTETMRNIILNRKKVKVHGNEFDFSATQLDDYDDSDDQETSDIVMRGDVMNVNGDKIYGNISVANNDIEIDRYGTCMKINLGGKEFKTESVVLNPDFSVSSIQVKHDSVDSKTPFLDIYLPMLVNEKFGFCTIHGQNFYTFDKDKNINGANQQLSFEVSRINDKFTEPKKMSLKEKMIFKLLREVADKIKAEGLAIFHLPSIISWLTFKDNYACVLIDKKLMIYEVNEEEQRYNLAKSITLKDSGTALTIFKNKVVALDCMKNMYVVDLNTKQLETCHHNNDDVSSEMFDYLNRVDDKYQPFCTREEFQKKLKKYFDKCVKKEREADIKKAFGTTKINYKTKNDLNRTKGHQKG